MKKTIAFLLFCSTVTAASAQARTRVVKKTVPATKAVVAKAAIEETKILLGEKEISVKGKPFNEIVYNTDLSYQKNKYVAYQYTDAAKKAIVITEVYYELINDKPEARSVDSYTLPKDKINKKDSYVLPMEDEMLSSKTYHRLTILNTGVNQQLFTKTRLSVGDEKPTIGKVSNVTINILSKESADGILKEFTK